MCRLIGRLRVCIWAGTPAAREAPDQTKEVALAKRERLDNQQPSGVKGKQGHSLRWCETCRLYTVAALHQWKSSGLCFLWGVFASSRRVPVRLFADIDIRPTPRGPA